jgi:hypothetical protein
MPINQTKIRATYDLPDWLNQSVGRIIVRFAYFEHFLKAIVWDLVGVDEVVGRLAVRDPRAEDTIDLIRDLAGRKGIQLLPDDISALKTMVNEASRNRDTLAHGAYTQRADGEWQVVQFSGTWPKQSSGGRLSRRVLPETLRLDPAHLAKTEKAIESLIQWAVLFPHATLQKTPP